MLEARRRRPSLARIVGQDSGESLELPAHHIVGTLDRFARWAWLCIRCTVGKDPVSQIPRVLHRGGMPGEGEPDLRVSQRDGEQSRGLRLGSLLLTRVGGLSRAREQISLTRAHRSLRRSRSICISSTGAPCTSMKATVTPGLGRWVQSGFSDPAMRPRCRRPRRPRAEGRRNKRAFWLGLGFREPSDNPRAMVSSTSATLSGRGKTPNIPPIPHMPLPVR